MRLLLVLLSSFALSVALICPEGWTDDTRGNCFSPIILKKSTEYTTGRTTCAHFFNSFMYDIKNAYDNTNVQAIALGHDYIWLGLSCLSNSSNSCLWDSGRQMIDGDYNNFFKGIPDISQGACVYMVAATGQWKTAPCDGLVMGVVGCQYTPNVNVPYCSNINGFAEGDYFHGNCYQMTNKTFIQMHGAQQECKNNHNTSDLASIHSEGENIYVRDLADGTNFPNFTIIGLQNSGNSHSWTDGTPYDYNNYKNYSGQGCTWMDVRLTSPTRGQWIDTPCSRMSATGNAMCKWKYQEPMSCPPVDCSKPVVVKGAGMMCSPNFPLASPAGVCEYVVNEAWNTWISIYFPRLLLDSESSITIYRGVSPVPIQVLTNVTLTDYDLGALAEANIARIIFNTTGNHMNFFRAHYSTTQDCAVKGTC